MTKPTAFSVLFGSLAWLVYGPSVVGMHTADVLDWLLGYYVLFAIGVVIWAVAKGHHPAFGICLGLFNVLGLVFVLLLPDLKLRDALRSADDSLRPHPLDQSDEEEVTMRKSGNGG